VEDILGGFINARQSSKGAILKEEAWGIFPLGNLHDVELQP
jgi:hypothetical protein